MSIDDYIFREYMLSRWHDKPSTLQTSSIAQ